jgi:DNA repair exonuclease SbcCD nuclease subunit
MQVRFIHTADWQLGKPFANFAPQLAGELAAARLAAIARIAAIARDQGARHVLVAGDVFDSDRLDMVTVRRALEHLKDESDITWLLLPGNHDPARTSGIWERIARIGLPVNVAALVEVSPCHLLPGAVVLPAPLTSKNPGRDPTEWMTGAETAAGLARVGLAHGSVQGFSSEGESSVNIARDRAATARLQYLALGDWHGHKCIDARTWYSGTPEPDRFPDNAPGFVLSVTIEGNGVAHAVPVPSRQFTWAKTEASLSGSSDIAGLDRILEGLAPSMLRHLLVRLKLTGSLTLSGEAELLRWREDAEGRLRHLDIDARHLVVSATAHDLEIFGSDGALRETANNLAALAGDARQSDSLIARLALQKLFALAAEVRQEAS